MNKFNAKKIVVDGETFDSKAEYKRYKQLRLLVDTGQIKNLARQVEFTLISEQRGESEGVYSKGAHKGEPKPGKLLERPVSYVADFMYEQNGETIVEDVKGCKSSRAYDIFVIKRKLMLYVHGIRVKEVR